MALTLKVYWGISLQPTPCPPDLPSGLRYVLNPSASFSFDTPVSRKHIIVHVQEGICSRYGEPWWATHQAQILVILNSQGRLLSTRMFRTDTSVPNKDTSVMPHC